MTDVWQRQQLVDLARHPTAEVSDEPFGAGHEVSCALSEKAKGKQDAFDFLDVSVGKGDRIWKACEELLGNRFDGFRSGPREKHLRYENGEGVDAMLTPKEVASVFLGPFDN